MSSSSHTQHKDMSALCHITKQWPSGKYCMLQLNFAFRFSQCKLFTGYVWVFFQEQKKHNMDFLSSVEFTGSLKIYRTLCRYTGHYVECCTFQRIWDLYGKREKEKKPEKLLNHTLNHMATGKPAIKSSAHTLASTMLLPCDCREPEQEPRTNAFICSHFTLPLVWRP